MHKGKGVLIIVMTWLILSWMLLCSPFLCYTNTITENPFAYKIAKIRKFSMIPLKPLEEEYSEEINLSINIKHKPSEDDVVWLIKYYSEKFWWNTDLALNIAWCESGYRIRAANKTSSARWIAQFLTRDWKRKDGTRHTSTWTSSSRRYLWYKWDVFNADEHVRVFVLKLKNEWPQAWNASRYCWDK